MFKSKLFQYCAIATAVIVTGGAIWANNANLQSQSPMQGQQIQAQLQPASQPEIDPKSKPKLEAADSELLAKNPERPDNADMPSGRMLKQLNLSPEQLQKLKAIRDRDLTKIKELAEKSRQANKELRDLLAGTESSDVIRAKHNQVLNLQQELQKQHFERMLTMREILTPEQRRQLNEIMQKNRQPQMRENMQNNMRDRVKNRMEKRIDGLRERPTL
jgi:Spy/CpxP family protein refolding chaperone